MCTCPLVERAFLDAQGSLTASFDAAHDEMQYASSNSASQSTFTDRVAFQHAANAASIALPDQPKYVLMTPLGIRLGGAESGYAEYAWSPHARESTLPGRRSSTRSGRRGQSSPLANNWVTCSWSNISRL